MNPQDKLAELKKILSRMGSLLVAYSGGVDSSFLAAVAHEVLGEKSLAVFAYSPVAPPAEKEEAASLAQSLGLRFLSIESHEMDNPSFVANPIDRCYYCKSELFTTLKALAVREGLAWVADGSNSDDLEDYRPGRKACAEAGVRSPLLEAGLTKSEIRGLSRDMGLPTWDRPASPCLASRIPYGTPVTKPVLDQIFEGEKFLRGQGFRQVRVRHHGEIARIEIDEVDMPRLMAPDMRLEIVRKLKELGFKYVALDLTGYRTGSLNAAVSAGMQGNS